jgi:hypothetical protein
MHDAQLPSRNQALGDLLRVPDRRQRRQRAVPQASAQRLPVQELGDDERHSMVGGDVVHGDDVGVVEQRAGARFARETRDVLGRDGTARRQQFDRDRPAEPGVVRPVDFSDRAPSDEAVDPIRTQ